MAGPQRRKKVHKCIKDQSKKCRTRRRTPDLDQIQDQMLTSRLQNTCPEVPLPQDLDLPGLGQFPCPACCKYFAEAEILKQHLRTKLHKKRVRLLREVPYSLEEAEAAAGMGNALVRQRKPLLPNPEVDKLVYRI